jgi:hypothetical protein
LLFLESLNQNYEELLLITCIIIFLQQLLFHAQILEEDSEYTAISPVSVRSYNSSLSKLSDYKFLKVLLKIKNPALNVIPYEPASSLLPITLTKAFRLDAGWNKRYDGDGNSLDLPVGSTYKDFFMTMYKKYNPVGATRIIETRIMIRKSDLLDFRRLYLNAEQTEAQFIRKFYRSKWKKMKATL